MYSDTDYIEFPKKEFDLLFKLLSYPDQSFSKNQLLDSIWGINSESGEDTVKTHVSRIRKRLAGISELRIQTIKGLGYKADLNRMAEELHSVQVLRSDFINSFSHEFKIPSACQR